MAMVGAASAAMVTTGATTATAAAATQYANDLWAEYKYKPSQPYEAQNLCRQGQLLYNDVFFGSPNGTSDQYFYCSPGANGNWNLWRRHRV
ncbi:hypothetical protein [Streptomyces scabiei]|uniref:hypothetical protein n=1 Tax=Streptomyces scabiei TaxID=1930 RepID=UPI0029BC3030|nr:hypothetical protein [Streptomyces scabiei]MDX3119217.1 hypothetical protein [Streptomyces scabiei]